MLRPRHRSSRPVCARDSTDCRVLPLSSDSVKATVPNSGVFVLPTMTKPASRIRRTTAVSKSGTLSANARHEYVVRMPAVAVRSFIAIGTPWNGLSAGALSRSRAAASASSPQTVTNEFRLRIETRDPFEVELDELDRGDLPRTNEASLLGRREEREVHSGDRNKARATGSHRRRRACQRRAACCPGVRRDAERWRSGGAHGSARATSPARSRRGQPYRLPAGPTPSVNGSHHSSKRPVLDGDRQRRRPRSRAARPPRRAA